MVGIEIANTLLCDKMSSMVTLNTYMNIFLKMCSFTQMLPQGRPHRRGQFCKNVNWNTFLMGFLFIFSERIFFSAIPHLLIKFHSFFLTFPLTLRCMSCSLTQTAPSYRLLSLNNPGFMNIEITSSSKHCVLKLNSDKHGFLKYRLGRKGDDQRKSPCILKP